MTRARAELLLTVVVAAVSSAFLFTKVGNATLGQLNVVALRLGIASLAMLPFTLRRLARANRATIAVGALLGILMAAVLELQAFGLDTVTTSEAGFLASAATGFVPIFLAVWRRELPEPVVALGCATVLVGIFLLTGAGLSAPTPGGVMYIGSSVAYAVFIIVVDRFSPRVDLLAAAEIELAAGFVIASVVALAFGTPRLPATGQEWAAIVALGVLCSAFGLGVQPWAQQFTTPERYGVLFGLQPLFSLLLGAAVLGESLSPVQMAGAAVLLAGVMAVVLGESRASSEMPAGSA